LGIAGLQKSVKVQEFATEGGGVGRPEVFGRSRAQRSANGCQLRIEIVEIVEDKSFADHRELGRSELVLAVMTNEQMLNDGLETRGEILDGVHGASDGSDFQHDMAKELSFIGVPDGALVTELVEFADVVKNGGREKQVAVELVIMCGDQLGHAAQTDHVL